MPDNNDLLNGLLDIREDHERFAEIGKMSEIERKECRYHWHLWALRSQLPPPGNWRCWLVNAGRGFGKTRAGADWIWGIARRTPDAKIALVGASLRDARGVMV